MQLILYTDGLELQRSVTPYFTGRIYLRVHGHDHSCPVSYAAWNAFEFRLYERCPVLIDSDNRRSAEMYFTEMDELQQ
ncbi:hypothetical protein TNCV_351111 [Trichonephila clavipes]|nr:hypothetical protein TNCV_351111 [Trichonephila clavipes]